MYKMVLALLFFCPFLCPAQKVETVNKDTLLQNILVKPTPWEIDDVLFGLRQKNLSPEHVMIHDTLVLKNKNRLYVLSHTIEGNRHYGAVIVPKSVSDKKLPVILFATGGDGMHTDFDIGKDFNHRAVQFPDFLGEGLDREFIVVIPSFRGQKLIIGEKKHQSGGDVGDAFDGATTDALGFLNVVIENFGQADENRIAIFGGSRGGTVALLAAARDKRIKKVVAVAAPTDMKGLCELYPGQFNLLFFNGLLSGHISKSEARRRFIASSPIYFLNELPMVQMHHDVNDPFVPIYFAKNLSCEMITNNKNSSIYFYEEHIHGFWDDESYWARVQNFVRELIE